MYEQTGYATTYPVGRCYVRRAVRVSNLAVCMQYQLERSQNIEQLDFGAAPLVRVKAKFTVKNAVCPSLPFAPYGVFDCDFGFRPHEWSYSHTG